MVHQNQQTINRKEKERTNVAKAKANNLFICINLHMCAFDPNHFILLFHSFSLSLSLTLVSTQFFLLLLTTRLLLLLPLVCILWRFSCVAIVESRRDIVVGWFFRSIFACCPRTHANNWSEWPYKYVTSLIIIVRAFRAENVPLGFYI